MSHGQSFIQSSMRTLLVVFLLFGEALAFDSPEPVVGDIDLDSNPHAWLGFPPLTSPDQVLISRRQYLINWSASQRSPAWVSWKLNRRALGAVGRTNVFRLDHDLSEYLSDTPYKSVSPLEYRGTCIDRGHQVASADRTATVLDNEATFIMSNIMPQSAFLNRKSWVSFERFLRNLVVEQGKEIFILSGGSGRSLGQVGVNKNIHLHSSNFKIAVIKSPGPSVPLSEMRLLAVNMPNKTSKGTNPVSDNAQACDDSDRMMRLSENNRVPFWRPYVTTLEDIQGITGHDFSYLEGIPPMQDDEIGAAIQVQISKSFDQVNLLQIARNAIESIQ